MTAIEVLRYIAIWSLIGALLFSIFVILVFRTGIAFAARNRDGTLKKRIPLTGILAMGTFVLLLIAFILIANRFGLASHIAEASFWELFALNFGLYLVLFAFDTFIIDAVVLGIWRPAFLAIPAELNSSSMSKHIRYSLPVGLVAGLLLALVTSTASYFLWAIP